MIAKNTYFIGAFSTLLEKVCKKMCIGAAFMHQDGEGFNIVLQALPINGKIVLRPPKAQAEQSQETPGKNNVRPLKNRREK